MEESAQYDYDQTNNNSTGANIMISPNPVRSAMFLSFKLDNESDVVVNIFNMLGNKVKSISLGKLTSGIHEENIDISAMPEGMYFCNLSTDNGDKNIVKFIVRH